MIYTERHSYRYAPLSDQTIQIAENMNNILKQLDYHTIIHIDTDSVEVFAQRTKKEED